MNGSEDLLLIIYNRYLWELNLTWPTKKLGEICETYPGGGITKSSYIDKGFPAFSAAGQDGFVETPNDSGFAIILSSIGARCGKCFFAEGKWAVLANTQVIKPEDQNYFTTKFFWYCLNDERKWPRSGTAQPFISPSTVKNLEISLPLLSEQKKIVYVLDSIQEAVRVQGEIIEKTRELKKAMMKKLFTEGTKGEELKETEISKMPKSWKVVELGKVSKRSKQKNPKEEPDKKIKYIDVSSISNDSLSITGFKEYYGKEAPSRAKKEVKTNDIIFATVRPYLRRVALIPQKFNGEMCSTAFCVIRAKRDRVSPIFLFNYISSPYFVTRVGSLQTGANYPAVSDKDILGQKIPLPFLDEQREIAEIFQTIDQKVEVEQKKKALYEELFQAMLNKLMSGEIRVNNVNF